jgi:hypothetical protein
MDTINDMGLIKFIIDSLFTRISCYLSKKFTRHPEALLAENVCQERREQRLGDIPISLSQIYWFKAR